MGALAQKHRATMARWQEDKSDAVEKSKVLQDVQKNTLLEQKSGSFTANATPILNATPSQGNVSHHKNKSLHYQSIIDENFTKCQECNQAEQALITALTEAVSAHTLSEEEAVKSATAIGAHDVASQAFTDALAGYTELMYQLTTSMLTDKASQCQLEYNEVASIAQQLYPKAQLAVQAEGWKQGNQSLMDSAQSAYMAAAAAALE